MLILHQNNFKLAASPANKTSLIPSETIKHKYLRNSTTATKLRLFIAPQHD